MEEKGLFLAPPPGRRIGGRPCRDFYDGQFTEAAPTSANGASTWIAKVNRVRHLGRPVPTSLTSRRRPPGVTDRRRSVSF
jgi:hypothetical protein